MAAARKNLIIDQNAIFDPILVWYSGGALVNLTGYTAKMQGRSTYNSTTTIFNLTTENGGITLGGAAGTISIDLSYTITAGMKENGVYDLYVIDTLGNPIRLLQGNFTTDPTVTVIA